MQLSWRDEAHRVWASLPAATPARGTLARFLADWPAVASDTRSPPGGACTAPHAPAAELLPVLRWLPRCAADAERFGEEFVVHLCEAADGLDWRQTYSVAEVGAPFLLNYAWTELVRGGGASQVACGVLVLGPNTFYPAHRHEAEEIYLPLSGTAEWQQGDAGWRRRPPGTLIHHLSEEPHAMRTGEYPLLAMYLWRGGDLCRGARLHHRSGE